MIKFSFFFSLIGYVDSRKTNTSTERKIKRESEKSESKKRERSNRSAAGMAYTQCAACAITIAATATATSSQLGSSNASGHCNWSPHLFRPFISSALALNTRSGQGTPWKPWNTRNTAHHVRVSLLLDHRFLLRGTSATAARGHHEQGCQGLGQPQFRAEHTLHRLRGPGGHRQHHRQRAGDHRLPSGKKAATPHQLLHSIPGHGRFASGRIGYSLRHPGLHGTTQKPSCLPLHSLPARGAVYHLHLLSGGRVRGSILGHPISDGLLKECPHPHGDL